MIRNVKVGIDIGTGATRVVVAEFQKDGSPPKILGTGVSGTRGMRHGYVIHPAEAARSIKKALADAEKNSGISIKRVYVSVGGVGLGSETATGSAMIGKADGEVTQIDIEGAMRESEESLKLTNKKVIHAIPISYRVDGKEILGSPEGVRGAKLEVKTLFVTSLEKHLDEALAVVRDAGVEIVDVIAGPIAGSFAALNDRQKTVGCALVNIGAETVSIAAFENGGIVSLQVFSIGSADITNDIALGLKIPLDEAEGIKTGSITTDYSKKKLDEIIEARLRDIFELIDNHLRKIKRSGLLPAGIIITGGGANLPGIEAHAKHALKLPAKIGVAELFEQTKSKVRDHAWFVAVGLTIAGATGTSERGTGFWKRIKVSLSNMLKQLMP